MEKTDTGAGLNHLGGRCEADMEVRKTSQTSCSLKIICWTVTAATAASKKRNPSGRTWWNTPALNFYDITGTVEGELKAMGRAMQHHEGVEQW